MTIRKVARLGHPVLRQKTQAVPLTDIGKPYLTNLLQDMLETMHEYGGIGLAAPQVHESLQVAIMNLSPEEDSEGLESSSEEKKISITVFINPTITVLDQREKEYWEGCLSIPGLRGMVGRPRQIKVEYWDENGNKKVLVAENFLSTVIQHELDHLEGVLYIDRMKDLTKLTFIEEAERYHQQDDQDHDTAD